jgi:hypothetical protein
LLKGGTSQRTPAAPQFQLTATATMTLCWRQQCVLVAGSAPLLHLRLRRLGTLHLSSSCDIHGPSDPFCRNRRKHRRCPPGISSLLLRWPCFLLICYHFFHRCSCLHRHGCHCWSGSFMRLHASRPLLLGEEQAAVVVLCGCRLLSVPRHGGDQ